MDKNINIKLQKEFLSLQEGFEWNNIPMFSVITGINGAGKTHLLKLLYESTKTVDLLEIKDSENNIFNLILPNNNDFNNNMVSTKRDYKQFLDYFKLTDNRLGKERELQNRVSSYKSTLAHHQQQLNSLINSLNPDKGSIINLENEVVRWQGNIYAQQYELKNLFDPIFENEIKRIASFLNKEIDNLKIEDIKENARTTFDGIFEINTIKEFIAEELQDKHSRIIKGFNSGKINENEITEIKNELESFQIINNLFNKYQFNYYTMDNPNPDINDDRSDINVTSDKIKLNFTGQKGEKVSYDNLSSGEKIIVKIIMLARSKNINGENINTIVLDEPDAHLHPSLSKMMIEILEDLTKPKEKGGADLRVIITTHSPSTVAFAPKESLYLISRDDEGKRTIYSTTKDEAVGVLSDGIFTYKEAIGKFEVISHSTKSNILCVEGKTDVLHINAAMHKLNRHLDLEIVDLHDAGTLANFVKSIPASILGGKKIIGLFDNDNEGRTNYNQIKGSEIENYKQLTSEQSNGQAYVCYLPEPEENLRYYCPIEFLYPITVLKRELVLEKRGLKEFVSLYDKKDSDNILTDEWKDEISIRVFKVRDSCKNKFAENLNILNYDDFIGFNPLLDLLEKIIMHKNQK